MVQGEDKLKGSAEANSSEIDKVWTKKLHWFCCIPSKNFNNLRKKGTEFFTVM